MKSRLRKPEPENLQLQSFAPDDPALPKPLGFRRTNRRKQDECEVAKLAATKRFGGLLPVQLGPHSGNALAAALFTKHAPMQWVAVKSALTECKPALTVTDYRIARARRGGGHDQFQTKR
jgi:hypothetical protein